MVAFLAQVSTNLFMHVFYTFYGNSCELFGVHGLLLWLLRANFKTPIPSSTGPKISELNLSTEILYDIVSVNNMLSLKKTYRYTNTVFENYVANTVLNTAPPAYFEQKSALGVRCALPHASQIKSLNYIDKW